jgi:hypothetical protein
MVTNGFLAQIPRILKIKSPQIGHFGMHIGASGTDHGFPAVARDPSPALAGWAGSLVLAPLAPMSNTPAETARNMMVDIHFAILLLFCANILQI